jgi:RNA polymerase sigma-70 factor, ECF subfamily
MSRLENDQEEWRIVASDAELVARVRRGDVEAFGQLAERYERSLLAAVLVNVHDVQAAEDVAQETLLRAFRRLGTLRDEGKFGPWLMQIARRQVVEAIRARRVPVAGRVNDSEYEAANTDNSQIWIEHEHLLSLVARLPDHERVLIGQRYFDGQSVAEIAAITSRPIGTVTKQLSRAIARLRSWWDEENLR